MSATKRHALRRTAWCCIRRATTTRSIFIACMGFSGQSQEEVAERQRRDFNSKLSRCKVGVEIVNGALKGGGVGPACADQLCYTAATDSNEGKFSRDEEAVRGDESKYGGYPDQIEHASIGTRHGLLSGGGAATGRLMTGTAISFAVLQSTRPNGKLSLDQRPEPKQDHRERCADLKRATDPARRRAAKPRTPQPLGPTRLKLKTTASIIWLPATHRPRSRFPGPRQASRP